MKSYQDYQDEVEDQHDADTEKWEDKREKRKNLIAWLIFCGVIILTIISQM